MDTSCRSPPFDACAGDPAMDEMLYISNEFISLP
jgi:hypothetical protein